MVMGMVMVMEKEMGMVIYFFEDSGAPLQFNLFIEKSVDVCSFFGKELRQ